MNLIMKKHIISKEDFIICQICKQQLNKIDGRHLKKHNLSFDNYLKMFPNTFTITEKQYQKEIDSQEKRKISKLKKSTKVIKCYYCKIDFEGDINLSNNFSVCKNCKKIGLKNPKRKEIYEIQKKSLLEKYGVDNPSKINSVVEKRNQTIKRKQKEDINYFKNIEEKRIKTMIDKYGENYQEILTKKKQEGMLEKYGVKHALQKEEFINKMKKTTLERYGKENAVQNEEVKEKQKQTMLNRYGKGNAMQIEEFQEKVKNTNQDRYNVDYPLQSKKIKETRKKNNLEKYGVEETIYLQSVKEKIKKTNLEKYGTEYPFQSKIVHKTIKRNNLEKYGVECTSKLSEVSEKVKKKLREKFLPLLKKQMEYLDVKLIDKNYEHSHFKHNWKCLKCDHEFQQLWNSIQQGYLCPKCFPRNQGFSRGEKEVAEFIKSLGFDIIENSRSIIPPFELDIFIPTKKIAIEFNGLYWHSEEFSNPKSHINKTKLCMKQEIRLIQIFEDEWVLKQDIVKNRLKHILEVSEAETIYARNCIIKEISPLEKNNFLDEYHVQGKDISSIKIGAFYNDKLVSVMTFSKGNRAKGSKYIEGHWELNRFCSNYNYRAIGIAGKMLSYFKENYIWKNIYSYCDLRWSDGNLYKKLGFITDNIIRLNYWYLKDGIRQHRFAFRKRPNEPKDIPEYILRLKEGYIRIWDCGNLKYILTI